MTSSYRRNTLALFIAAVLPAYAGAQSLQTGPELLRGGQNLVQVNPSDASYDPNEVQRSLMLGTDQVRNGQQISTGGFQSTNLPGAAVYDNIPTREGLIDFKFTVKADGTVSDLQVVGGFYDESFRQEATAGLSSSVFHSPMSGTSAVDWPAYSMRVILRAPIMPSVSPALTPELERVTELLIAKNYGEAETLINELLATKAQTLFDYALLQDQLASVYLGTERPHAALVALRNATSDSTAIAPPSRPDSRLARQEESYPEEYLIPELYRRALERRFTVAAALNQTGEALNIVAKLDARGNVPAELDTQVDAIRSKLATDEPIGSQIRLVNGSWTFETSTRRVFGMTGLQGEIDFVDIACGKDRRRRMAFANDSEFGLPASWQNCKLEFHGADGASFLLYEYLN